jgi:glycosyltransferase involved in cell wall biosynthesis
MKPGARIAVFAATSGHSGVDRVIANLVTQWAAWGLSVHLLKVRRHGPTLDPLPAGVRSVDLGTSHVNSSLPALVGYLRRERPTALLTDKDRVNRMAILARALARVDTRLAVRVGTTVSVNLRGRGAWERWLQRASMGRLYPLADRVLVPSAGAADDLANYTGLDRRHIGVVPSPIATPTLQRRAAEPADHPWLADARIPVILGVGELGYRTDFETLLRAFALVRQERPCRLLILGRGRRRDDLLRLAAKLGVGDDVDLPGFTANPYASMARARVFALSSRWEGMPVVLVEALACHTPVVSTDCPSGPREILGDGTAGALVPVGDHAAMAHAIGLWLDRHVPDEVYERAVTPYRVEVSACAYLRELGLECPGTDGGN